MKSTVVKLSDLNNRWDAAYHIGLSELPSDKIINSIKTKIKEEVVIDLLNKLPVDFLKDALHIFETGSRGISNDKVSTIKKYPYEIYAHVVKHKNKEILSYMNNMANELSFISESVSVGTTVMNNKKSRKLKT